MNPASPQYQSYRKMMDDAMRKIQADPSAARTGLEDLRRIGYQIKGATEIEIGVATNMPGASATNCPGDHIVLNVPGAAYAVFVPFAQASIGGGADNAQPRALILLGPWASATVQKHDDGGELISVKPVFDKSAPTLSVQNIQIRISAGQELVRNILRQLDLTPLQALLHR